MPLPTPKKGEKQADFIPRCISAVHEVDPETPNKQAVAMCYSQWRGKEARHEDFERIFQNFARFFPEEGLQLYMDFLDQNGLDETKPYSRDQLLKESFDWAKPSIPYWRHDEEAKYYPVRLLSMGVSMNENDYSNEQDSAFAASNLAWRPLNLDHRHELRLPFPGNRVEVGRVSEEGNTIEAVIRVANDAKAPDTDESVQELIEQSRIFHPSIEAYPICGSREEGGRNVPTCGFYIDEVALLRKSNELPGDPLSRVFPLPLNESLSRSLVESLSHGHSKVIEDVFRGKIGEKQKNTEEKMKMSEKTIPKEAFGDASFPDSCFAYVPPEARGENGQKSLRKMPYKNADGSVSIRHVRNALARLDQTEGIPADEKERIRTMLQNILKKDNPDYQPPESLDKDAENAKLQADLAAEKKSHADDNEVRSAEIKELTRKTIELQEKLAKTERVEGENTSLKAQITEGATKRAELEKAIKERDAAIERLNETAKVLKECKDELERTVDTYKKTVVEKDEKIKSTALDLKESRIREAAAKQESLEETKQRATIQEENGNLRDEIASTMRKYSDLTQTRAKEAKRLQQSETDNAALKEAIESQNTKYEKARKRLFQLAEYLKREHNETVEGLQAFKD